MYQGCEVSRKAGVGDGKMRVVGMKYLTLPQILFLFDQDLWMYNLPMTNSFHVVCNSYTNCVTTSTRSQDV